jgi:hypothetical protein
LHESFAGSGVRTAAVAVALAIGMAGQGWAAGDEAGTGRAGPTPIAARAATLAANQAAAAGGQEGTATGGGSAQAPADEHAVIAFFRQTEISGLVDGYYMWAFNEEPLELHTFDVNHNSFSLGYAEIAFAKTPSDTSRAGFRFDVGAGDTAEQVNAFEPGGVDYLKYVQQAYLSYLAPVGNGLTIDFGKFVTPHGAEVIENHANFNYSRGLLFSLAIPFYHAGVRMAYPVSETVTVTGFLVNGWNNVRDNNDDKTVGVSLAFAPTEQLSITQNYMVGKELDEEDGVRNLFDTVVSYTASDRLQVVGNFDYGRDAVAGVDMTWYGLALGAKYQVNDRWAFAPRYEIFKDSDGFATGLPQTLQGITLTAEYVAPGGLLTRFEYRSDFSDEEYYTKGLGLEKNQSSIRVGLMYAFGGN